ncbi:FAD-dependent oxidoreductase [Nocardia nova]|uniref:FAD-dependent oxidoreductase n=1 Tax=Nocardia nova TaxID=37330 RepID=UPI0004BA21DF|nr:FAD-dependent oxidoreductase [Nocardia nova]
MSERRSPLPVRRVLIIGGGIAGLTAAVALRGRGHDVEVLERQREWPAVGWGLSLTGPALRALRSIGLERRCAEAGFGIDGINNCDVRRTLLHEVLPPSLLGPGEPIMVGIGRPALSRALREAAETAGATLNLGAQVTGIEESADSVTAVLADGTRKRADLVVAADGVNSATRAAIGIADTPAFLGQAVWRTTVPRPVWADRLTTFNAARHSSGIIPISDRDAYIFTTQITPERTPRPDADLAAGMRELLAPLEGEMAAIRDGIVDSERIVRRAVLGLLVDGPWHRGRVVLIGDAAHTCAPHMVSGAALAVEDAVVLAEELEIGATLEESLTHFWQRRLERARLVVDAAQAMVDLEFEHRYAEEHEVQGRAFAALATEA